MAREFPYQEVKEAYFNEGTDLLEQVYEGAWEQDGKYQYQEVVFKAADDGKHYILYATRSRSPFTDWYYDQFEYAKATDATKELDEVELVEKITYSWETVK